MDHQKAFLKPLLNLLQYCFYFMFVFFWPWGMWNLSSPPPALEGDSWPLDWQGSLYIGREGNGNPLQYSCLQNSTDRGAWQATVHEVTKESDTTEWLTHTHTEPGIVLSTLHVLAPVNPHITCIWYSQNPCEVGGNRKRLGNFLQETKLVSGWARNRDYIRYH